MNEDFTLPTKRILIEFIGGDADGKYFDSASENVAESLHAKIIYMGTRNGAIGAGLQGMPMAWIEQFLNGQPFELRGYHPHRYEVFERFEEGNEVHLRMRYRGQVVPNPNDHTPQ